MSDQDEHLGSEHAAAQSSQENQDENHFEELSPAEIEEALPEIVEEAEPIIRKLDAKERKVIRRLIFSATVKRSTWPLHFRLLKY